MFPVVNSCIVSLCKQPDASWNSSLQIVNYVDYISQKWLHSQTNIIADTER